MAENKNAQQTSLITKKDVRKSFILWHAFAETSLNFERLQALAFCNSLTGILKKLYPNKEDLSAALQRHLTMYNTEANWGAVVNGITIALEEQVATTTDEETKKSSTDKHV